MALCDHRWAFQPVCPTGLFNLLRVALTRETGIFSPEEIVSAGMPDVSDEGFRDKYLLREVLRKYPKFDLGIDTRLAAKTAFYADEAVNASTNDRLLSELPTGVVASVLQLARKKIAEILGRFDEEEFWQGWRFGPHSTLSLSRLNATVDKKLLMKTPKSTARALPLFLELLSREPMWAYSMTDAPGGPYQGPIQVGYSPSICEFDRWESVLKNAKTDRGIGIPPDVNVVLQLSAGKMLRSRLHRAGIDLNDQSVNQRLAYQGSLSGRVATVDVKSASQSITCGLVWNLLGSQPSRDLDMRWYAVLDALRTPYTLVDGDMHENELFSAMGNGYTFELESLVFYALAHACTSYLNEDTSAVSVYGDDIILPVGAYPLLLEAFSFCGFRINEDKTFATAGAFRFRESCGKHYLNGVDVTPFYVDGPLESPESIILLANNLHRWAVRDGYRDGRVYPVWLWILSHLGEGYLGSGIPFGESNDGVILDWDEACPRAVHLKREGVRYPTFVGWNAKTASFEARPRKLPGYRRYLRWQYHASMHSGFKPPEPPRLSGRRFSQRFGSLVCTLVEPSLKTSAEIHRATGSKKGLKIGSRVVTSWPRLGPWVFDDCVVNSGDVQLGAALIRGSDPLSCMPPLYERSKHVAKPAGRRRTTV